MKKTCFVLCLFLLIGCMQREQFNVRDIEQSISQIPDFDERNLIKSGHTIKFEVESHPDFTDSLILVTKNGKVIQERKITVKNDVNSLVLSFPKSFANTTDDLLIRYTGQTSSPEWRVIQKDPVIELVNIKKDQINRAISVKTAVDLLERGQSFFEVAQNQAKLHQVLHLLKKTDEMEDTGLRELYVLALISKFPKVFEGSVEIWGDSPADYFEDEIKAAICRAIINNSPGVCEQYQGDRKHACQFYLFQSLLSRAGNNISDEKLLEMIKTSGYKQACASLSGNLKQRCMEMFEANSSGIQEEDNTDKVIISSNMEDIYNAEVDCEFIAGGAIVQKTASWDPDDSRYRRWPKGEIQCELRFEDIEYPNFCIVNIRPYETKALFLSAHKVDFPDTPDKFRKVVMHGENAVYITEFYKNNRIFIQCGKGVPYEEVNANVRALIDRKMPSD